VPSAIFDGEPYPNHLHRVIQVECATAVLLVSIGGRRSQGLLYETVGLVLIDIPNGNKTEKEIKAITPQLPIVYVGVGHSIADSEQKHDASSYTIRDL
jgi:hypothetical protein